MIKYRPVLTNNFNVYVKGTRQISVASGFELPELKMKTETVDGAGVAGELEEPAQGQYESCKAKIPFIHLSEEATALLNTLAPTDITVRGAVQGIDDDDGSSHAYPFRVALRGKSTSFKPGTLTKGAKSDTEIELECSYMKIEIDGHVVFELDKLHSVNVVNDVDVHAELRGMC